MLGGDSFVTAESIHSALDSASGMPAFSRRAELNRSTVEMGLLLAVQKRRWHMAACLIAILFDRLIS